MCTLRLSGLLLARSSQWQYHRTLFIGRVQLRLLPLVPKAHRSCLGWSPGVFVSCGCCDSTTITDPLMQTQWLKITQTCYHTALESKVLKSKCQYAVFLLEFPGENLFPFPASRGHLTFLGSWPLPPAVSIFQSFSLPFTHTSEFFVIFSWPWRCCIAVSLL